ncbi:hypothetical protein MRB53_019973 [Persea americana]|uniref:Uncharacterized protein n=1 Tax=Persea americana TaxID=3435 RepID=A0ACC2KZJ2_PERAE|nr:hypothetical protein MRB53_019973 [Persea americana]
MDGNSSVLRGTDVESCKQACLNNCSCKAAFFQYDGNISDGSCFLPSQLFSLMNNQREKTGYDSSAFIKVPTPSSSASFCFALVRKRRVTEKEEEDSFDQVPGMPKLIWAIQLLWHQPYQDPDEVGILQGGGVFCAKNVPFR